MMTPTQIAQLRAAIAASPVAGPMLTAQDTYSLIAWCNAPSTTLAWRTTVPASDSDEAARYTTYDSLAQGKRDSWSIFLMFPRSFAKLKVRNWVVDIWGAAIVGSISEDILKAGTEFATNAQAALATAAGDTTIGTGAVTALIRSFTERVAQEDVNKLVN
jgi:hypothetical protein